MITFGNNRTIDGDALHGDRHRPSPEQREAIIEVILQAKKKRHKWIYYSAAIAKKVRKFYESYLSRFPEVSPLEVLMKKSD